MTGPIEPAIRLVGVGKKYRLFKSHAERLKEALHPFAKRYHEEFWALNDVTLEIPQGQTLGILGINGSGKSTLLQMIAGVLKPSLGHVETAGRVAALLELGAGFNPELTGRDNVITNALIMGLSREDAEDRLDEVRNFADIGRHFDQPVKTYSSGMFMRVAFAMSICVDPDILIIDEALAVGDAKFQEKCFRRLKEFQAAGKTVLFVTHDRSSVMHLCDRAILLHQGRLVAQGEPKKVVDDYTELMVTGRLPGTMSTEGSSALAPPALNNDRSVAPGSTTSPAAVRDFFADNADEDRLESNPLYNSQEQRWGVGGARVVAALVMCEGRTNPTTILSGAETEIYVKIAFDQAFEAPLIGMTLTNLHGVTLYGSHSSWMGADSRAAAAGQIRFFRFRLDLCLSVGPWFIELAVARHQTEVCDVRSRVLQLEIIRNRMLIGLVDLSATCCEIDPDCSDA